MKYHMLKHSLSSKRQLTILDHCVHHHYYYLEVFRGYNCTDSPKEYSAVRNLTDRHLDFKNNCLSIGERRHAVATVHMKTFMGH